MLFTTFFLQFPGNEYHVNCVASATESALRFKQDKINNVFGKTGWHTFCQHIACYREKGDATTVATQSVRSPFCMYARMLAFFHCCDRHLAGQQSRIKLCSLLFIAHPPYLMTSSGLADLLCLRLRMTFTTTSRHSGSSSFGMNGSVDRSSRKPGSVEWTLFCRYSAHLARINFLFLIRTPSILLTGYKEKRLGP